MHPPETQHDLMTSVTRLPAALELHALKRLKMLGPHSELALSVSFRAAPKRESLRKCLLHFSPTPLSCRAAHRPLEAQSLRYPASCQSKHMQLLAWTATTPGYFCEGFRGLATLGAASAPQEYQVLIQELESMTFLCCSLGG